MLEFFANNLDFILTTICAIVICIYLARRGQLKKIREIILSLCTNAEIEYGGGTGEIKRSSVIEAVYDLLPSWAKLIVSEATISRLVEEGKTQMDELANINDSIKNLINYNSDETADNDKPPGDGGIIDFEE